MVSDDSEEQRLLHAVSARPEDAVARAALAARLADGGNRNAAMAVLREGVFFAAARADRLEALAEGFLALGAVPDAIDLLQAALRADVANAPVYARLAGLWAALGERGRAEGLVEKARALGMSVELDSVLDGPTPLLARHLFDQYAAGFDEHLLAKLEYAAPRELARLLQPYANRVRGSLAVDLGCGTGLMGPYLRGMAGMLTGIDLSPAMLDEARRKGLYDRLIESDIVSVLADMKGEAALLAAADVLVYLGDLAPLFAVAAGALVPGGLFAATVERHEGSGFILTSSRRYAHADSYIVETARAAGLRLLHAEAIVPRRERGQPVSGAMFLLEKL